MMGIRISLVLVGVICALQMASAQEQASLPAYSGGESWYFKIDRSRYENPASLSGLLSGDYEVSFANGEFKTLEMTGSGKAEFTDGLGMLLGMFGKENWHGGQFLNFPLFVGKKWEVNYTASLAGQGSRERRTWKADVTVLGTEQITTAMGPLEVFRIQNKQLSSGRTPVPVTIDYYYSPKAKSIVKLSFAGRTGSGSGGKADIELIKFHATTP